jgi:hypothetical protein
VFSRIQNAIEVTVGGVANPSVHEKARCRSRLMSWKAVD